MASSRNENPTVYSTEHGRICPKCGYPVSECRCRKGTGEDQNYKQDGIVRLYIDRKGRGGKTVTIIDGLKLSELEMKDLAKKLKHQCGAGGSIKERKIEIQGDVRDQILPILQKMGMVVKKAGG
ncbi:MAG: hypothetical protein CVU46_04755 [Chloroflexi bacterium HGW-Chloroflexi-8]|jgi:translation initiation factor 1|nr:MAG: hypothetical protein CVU46_04755 [Chloroflexi bacterium HGW-Chloroflexi-8]